MASILFPSNLLLISKSQLLRFSHPSFDTFLGTLIQTFSLFSPDSPKKWTSEKAAGAVLLSSAPNILVQCVTCPVGCMKGLKRRENLLVSCHVLFAVICYIMGFFAPIDYNEYPPSSSLLWQIKNVLDPLQMAPSPGSYLCLSENKGVSLVLEHPFHMYLHIECCWCMNHICESCLSISRCPLMDSELPTMVLPSPLNSRAWPIAEHMGESHCRNAKVKETLQVTGCSEAIPGVKL